MSRRNSMAKRFSNYVDYIQSRNRKTRALYLLSILGLLLFLTIAITLPFNDSLLNRLYPKDQQQASESINGNLVLNSTFQSIGVEVKNTTEATGILEFKKSSETTWRKGIDMWQAGGTLYGSALLLDSGTTYDVKVSYGGTSIQGQVSTRADNIPPASSLTPTHFVRTDGNDANAGTSDSPSGAWKTLHKALTAAPSGAVVMVDAGYYASPNSVNKDLLRSTPITFVAKNPAVDDNREIINQGKHSVVEFGLTTSPTGSGSTNAGVWTQVPLKGPATGGTYNVWKWTSPLNSNYPAVAMGYAATRQDIPQRLASWDRKSGTVTDKTGRIWTMSTPEGWAEVLYTNKRYNYGFAFFGSDIYLRMPNDANPNNYYYTITGSTQGGKSDGFAFDNTTIRLSGFQMRQVDLSLWTNSYNSVVDHNLYIGSGVQVYGKDHVIERNRFVDSSLFDSGSVSAPITWLFIKDSLILSDGTPTPWSRVGSGSGGPLGAEGTAAVLRQTDNIVIRNNTVKGVFNGFGTNGNSYDVDLYNNSFHELNDDAFEPEGSVFNWRIWNNRIENTAVALSTGPVHGGPIYFMRNQVWRVGSHGNAIDGNGDIGIGGLGFKYSGSQNIPLTKARVNILHNTFWTNSKYGASGGNQFAGGGTSTERFYLRNNIFRMTAYAFSAPQNTQGTSDKWNEDYNYFATTDPNRAMNYNSNNIPSLTTYRTITGQGAHTNLDDTSGDFHTFPDAWLADPINGNIALTSSSPLINKGIPVPNISDNYDAKSAYSGSAPDLGAIEYGVTGQPNPTATPVITNPTATPTPIVTVPTATPTQGVPTPTPTGGVGGTGGTTVLSISPFSQSKTLNATHDSVVNITTQNNITNVDLSLRYDPTIIHVDNITIGGTTFIPNAQEVTKTIDNTTGKVFYSFYVDAASAKSGTGTLAKVTWHGVKVGTTSLSFDAAQTIVYGVGQGNTIAPTGGLKGSGSYTITASTNPTATPTNAPTATPTQAPPTPTSTPVPVPCTLQNATWSTAAAGNGEQVTLRVTTNGSASCIGKQVSFDIHENDSIAEGGLDDTVSTNPANTTISSTTVTRTWQAEWQNDCGGFCNPNEFYFNAQIVGQSGSSVRSQEPYLTISETATPVYTLQVQLNKNVTVSSIPNAEISVTGPEGTITKSITLNKTTTAGIYQGSLPLLVDPGTYSLSIRLPGYLVKKYTISITSTSTAINVSNQPLLAGDVDGNNIVNTLDLGQTIEEYSPESFTTSTADTTFDDKVNALDLGLIIENYFKSGE